jgi:transcriptional regulator with XRE-family HTH domain
MTSLETTREQIASRLRTAREAAGLSQGQVAKLLDLHRPTISEIEAARRRVSAEELTRFASLYGVSTEWLTTAGEEADPSEDRILLAARELSKMKDQDLDKLLSLLRMLRRSKGMK